MDQLDVDQVARIAMLSGTELEKTTSSEAPKVNPAPAASPIEIKTKTKNSEGSAKLAEPNTSETNITSESTNAFKMPSMKMMKTVVSHTAFRLLSVYLISFVILVAINPPFVQARSKKKRNALEAAPCSYGRVMVASAIITTLVALIPLCLQHRERLGGMFSSMQKWIKNRTS
jgi:hypothetical protein